VSVFSRAAHFAYRLFRNVPFVFTDVLEFSKLLLALKLYYMLCMRHERHVVLSYGFSCDQTAIGSFYPLSQFS